MSKNEQLEAILKCLNEAHALDSEAIGNLIGTRIPCNSNLAEHPIIIVGLDNTIPGNSIGCLGLLNGILVAAGLSRIGIVVDIDDNGKGTVVGFKKV